MLDLKITGGTIVDGSGGPRFPGDIGIKDGRIAAIGQVAEEARKTVEIAGRIVAPGFVDVHTHYDAQVFWDPALSPSCFHGVTTVIGGFCGFSIAPMTPEAAGYIKPMLARVEGMPLKTLDAAVPWNWSVEMGVIRRISRMHRRPHRPQRGFFCRPFDHPPHRDGYASRGREGHSAGY